MSKITMIAIYCAALLAITNAAPASQKERQVDCERALRKVDASFDKLAMRDAPHIYRTVEEFERRYCSKTGQIVRGLRARRTCHKGKFERMLYICIRLQSS